MGNLKFKFGYSLMMGIVTVFGCGIAVGEKSLVWSLVFLAFTLLAFYVVGLYFKKLFVRRY